MVSDSRGVTTNDQADWRRFEPFELTPLLQAALDAFFESGFHGTSVRDIAKRVGQTVPSLYYHHENKEGVLIALLDRAISDVTWRVKAAAEEGGDRPDLRFMNVTQAVVLHMTHRLQFAALDAELRYLSESNRKHYAELRKEVEDVLEGIVEDGVQDGRFVATHPAETARAVLGMCQHVARWYRPEGPLSPDEVANRYVDIALMTVGVTQRPQVRGVRGKAARDDGRAHAS